MEKEIKKIVMMLNLNYKSNPKKLNQELKLLLNYIKKSDLYKGKKKKLYKLINSNKIKN
jgi:hypothetical protein